MILAIVPARIGSKGIREKNIRVVAGKPLALWTLDAAKRSKLVDEIIISSDDDRVLGLAKARVLIHKRSAENSSDTASLESVIDEVLATDNWYDVVEAILLLQPTSPIRTGEQIDAAISQLRQDGADTLLSAVRTHSFIWRRDEFLDEPLYCPSYDYDKRPRRQDLEPSWEENGSIYITTMEHWKRTHCRLGGKISLFEMPEESKYQVDSELDLHMVEKIMERQLVSV